jgi:hypothetical protein
LLRKWHHDERSEEQEGDGVEQARLGHVQEPPCRQHPVLASAAVDDGLAASAAKAASQAFARGRRLECAHGREADAEGVQAVGEEVWLIICSGGQKKKKKKKKKKR